MKAMILAAGEGRRMRPLTDVTPKPLLEVAGKPLIEHHIARLSVAGFSEVVVNVSHLGQQLVDFLGDGSQWRITISISAEQTPLETAGGIIQALPRLGDAPFLLVNGDVFSDYPFAQLRENAPAERGAHIVLVPNPEHHSLGDFALQDGRVGHRPSTRPAAGDPMVGTYSGIGVYDPGMFANSALGRHPLKPLLDQAIVRASLSGELYQGVWEDVGTPERLAALNRRFPSDSANQ
jgi:MurNAc alpha-1-phosphate uridylyltransferase